MSTEHLLGDVGIILDALMGSADGPRQEAEHHLRHLVAQQTGQVLLVFAQIGALGVGGFQLDHRLLTLILLRRLAFRGLPGLFLNSSAQVASAPFDVIRERTRDRIEGALCAGLKDEMDVRIRKGLGSCAASWAQESALRQRPCLPLPPVLLSLTASPHPFHRYTPFQLLYLTPTLLVDSVTDPIPIEQLAQIILGGMNDPSVDVRVEAIMAMKSVLLEGVTGREREQVGSHLVFEAFKQLPNLPLNVLSHALVPLVDLASLHPNLFIPNLPQILSYLLSLLSPPTASLFPYTFSPYPPSNMTYEDWEEIASPATEIILSLAELRGPQTSAWEAGRVGKEMIGLLIARQVGALLDQGEDCKEWLEETDLDEEDVSYPAFAEESLDRLAIALGGKNILPALSEHVQSLLQQPDWRGRYCALIAVGSVAEGCVEELVPRIGDVLNIISPSAKDAHPRVRYGFIQCIGQLLNDCGGTLQSSYSAPTMQVLLEFLSDPVARVRAHAIACLANFYGYDELKLDPGDVEPVVKALIGNFHQGPLYVQEQVVATLSGLAVRAERAFTSSFGEVMELLLRILTADTDDTHYKLVGRSMECAALIGLAVGKAAFASQAVNLATIMIGIQNKVTNSDDIRSSYLMEAWGNLCRILGNDFAPFLTYVVPPLLKAAAHVPKRSTERAYARITDTSIEDIDENKENHEAAEARTAEMEEKELAFEQLTIYAFQMGAVFEPYLMRSMELSLEALTFQYSEAVREAAAYLVPGLLQVAKDAKSWEGNSAVLEQVFQSLISAMVKEVDFGFLSLLYKSFTDSLHVISTPLPPILFEKLVKTTENHLRDLLCRRQDRELQSPYMDESDLEMLKEVQSDEDGCLDDMRGCLEMVIGIFGGTDGEAGQVVQRLIDEAVRVKRFGLKRSEYVD